MSISIQSIKPAYYDLTNNPVQKKYENINFTGSVTNRQIRNAKRKILGANFILPGIATIIGGAGSAASITHITGFNAATDNIITGACGLTAFVGLIGLVAAGINYITKMTEFKRHCP